jgi:hypothetical protein
MQKLSSYLYQNRIQILADLAGFNVEYTNVYQRNVKIYNGINNTLEFDIKNADQKRIDLTTFSLLKMNVMDAAGKALPNSPYTVVPSALKGIAVGVIPGADLTALSNQYLTYSLVATKDLEDVILYTNSRFEAIGTLELINNAIPSNRPVTIYNSFIGEIDLLGNVINHTSAMPATFYEAVPTTALRFTVEMTEFIGTIWLMGTTKSTITSESFRHSATLLTYTFTVPNSSPLIFTNVEIADFKYFRVYYQGDNPLTPTGSVNRVLVEADVYTQEYNIIDGGGSEGAEIILDGGSA